MSTTIRLAEATGKMIDRLGSMDDELAKIEVHARNLRHTLRAMLNDVKESLEMKGDNSAKPQ